MAVQIGAWAEIAAGAVTHLSLHSTDGGSDGSGELTGGSYQRQEPSYGSPSNGTVDLDGPVEFGGPATASTASHLGFWAGSTWLGSAPLAQPKTGFVDRSEERRVGKGCRSGGWPCRQRKKREEIVIG